MEAEQVKLESKQQQLQRMKKTQIEQGKKKLVPINTPSLKSKAKQVISDEFGKPGSKKKRTNIEDLYDSDEAKLSVLKRAEVVLENVPDEFPSFTRCMLPSNVTHGFWLFLPKEFCNLHLPMRNTTVILVDESGKEYEANYLVERKGLSAGWRAFALAHGLVKGDLLVFHLIKPRTLKVDIVRVHSLDEINAALCLVNLVADCKRISSSKNKRTWKRAQKSEEPVPLDIPPKNIEKSHSGTDFEDFSSGVSEGSTISNDPDQVLEAMPCRFVTGKVS